MYRESTLPSVRKRCALWAVVLLTGWPLAVAAGPGPQAGPPEVNQQPPEAGTPGPTAYVLGPDDLVFIHEVVVPDIGEKPQKLDREGDLRLPMVGRIHAAGMTVADLERELTKRLKVYLQEPDVTVTVAESRSQPVAIIGAVTASGIKQLEGGKTLVEVLSMSGGLTADAGPTVRIARKLAQGRIPLPEAVDDPSGAFSIVDLDARALLEGRTPEKNIIIQPSDVISIPRADVVYVIGEVTKPGPVVLSGEHSITVMEAVSASGGALRTAAPGRVRILRRAAGQEKRTEIPVDLQKVMNGKADDVALSAGDILVIPDSSGKRVTTRAIEAALQLGLMVGTYGIIR
jgi:polysaccharide export outer membrane protein